MDINVKDVNLGVIGCGKMASAILEGIYKSSFLNPKNIFLYDVNDSASSALAMKFGFNKVNSIDELLNCANTLLFAIKPFGVDDLLNKIKKNYKNQLILSIIAGIRIQKYQNYINNAKIIRIMPNTPALVNEGMSAICKADSVDDYEFEFAYNFMKNCGRVIKTTEDKMDIITALSGSGPAFYYIIIDYMARSAQKLGLDYDDAILLSTQTALGSAKMILENDFDIQQLIKNVTTPNGTTEAGSNVLLHDTRFNLTIDRTIEAACNRASELGRINQG